MINQIEALADRLGKRSVFRSVSANSIRSPQDYNIFMGVPVHCLTMNKAEVDMERDFPHHAIDLLICRGKEAVLAIVLDAEYTDMEKLFSTHLQTVPHEFLKSEELNDDTEEAFCGDIECRLRCDRNAPQHTGCMLHSICIQHAIFKMDEPTIKEKVRTGYRPFLEEKHLIQSDGSVSGYGRVCGVFRHWRTSSKRSIYVTVPQAIGKLKQAMLWRDVADAELSLASRLARLKQGLPSNSSGQKNAVVSSLLHTPLEKLFQNYPEAGHRLNTLLSHAQFLSRESRISAFGDREDIETYGDVIYTVKNLWEYTAHGDCRNTDAAGTCEQILAYLSFPLWTLPSEDSCKKGNMDRHSDEVPGLQIQLEQLCSGVYDFSFGIMPLSHYFYAAACLTESEYPLWLYRTCVKPWLELYFPEELCFARTMEAAYSLSQSDDENIQADYFPLLYDILVEPVRGIV